MILPEWHERLDTHFHQLNEERSREGGRPVFALEHGLDDREIAQLKEDVREYITTSRPNKYWLPWIVYAAELGYEYIGYEYWQTFEESTNGWLQNGNRYYVRDKFKIFCRDYGGARPTGLWAEHRTIICYPITHAVLPKDFQRQLARVLYETRRLFTPSLLQSPPQLGALIATHSTDQSDRFQRFVQNIDLLGLIAKELLSHYDQDTQTILLRSTLLRIVKDLEHERNARNWLRDARDYAARASETRGLSTGSRAVGGPTISGSHTKSKFDSIEPRLKLRRSGEASWDVLLQIPDLASLIPEYPHLKGFLANARFAIKGADPRCRLARGQLFGYGPQDVPIKTLPSSEETELLHFEGSIPDDLQHLIKTEFRLDKHKLMLCRIGSDGFAYQMNALVVRPDREYIILSDLPLPPSPLQVPIKTTCANVTAVRLHMPEKVTRDHRLFLEGLGLIVAEKVCVIPAGFAAASWDDQGCGEWLADEVPCISINIDHYVDSVLLQLDGNTEKLEVSVEDSSLPLYIQLPLLPVGGHELCVSSRLSESDRYEELGFLAILIREPRTWRPGVNNQGAFIAIVEPRSPSLEQLWEGLVNLELHGPEGHLMTCSATFFAKDLDRPLLSDKSLFTVELPLRNKTWKARMAEQLGISQIQSAGELAYACRLNFDAGELGFFTINCEREVRPLRWIIERDSDSYLLTLSDDAGSESSTAINFYDFSKPDMPMAVLSDSSFRRHPVEGGLFVARSQDAHCSIIVPRKVKTVFRTPAEMLELQFNPRLRNHNRSLSSVTNLIRLYELWASAPATGSVLANWDRRNVLNALLTQIFGLIDNTKLWARAEAEFASKSDLHSSVEQLSRAVSSARDVRNELMTQLGQAMRAKEDALSPKDYATALAVTVRGYIKPIAASMPRSGIGVASHILKGAPWQAEFALRLASSPGSLCTWAGDWFEPGLNAMLQNPTLARAARFFVLVIDRIQRNEPTPQTSLYSGWEWQ